MVSMKDIANHVNLSRCTVSNILNNRLNGKTYRQETIDLVLKTAKEMGYVSNNMARALKTGSTGTIAIVVPDIANTFYIKIIKEVERRANECGYSLIICMAEEILEKENAALTMLQSRCVDGVLISPVSFSDSLKTRYPFKVVCFDRTVEGERFPSVLIDNRASGRALAEALIADGARKPLFLAGSRRDYTVVQRYLGFCDAMHAHGIPLQKDDYIDGLYDEATAYAALKKIMDRGQDFDAVYLCTNYFIYGVLCAMREKGREVLSIGGFERFCGMELLDGSIHVLEQPESEIGRVAFESLQKLLKGGDTEGIILPTQVL